MTVTDGGYSNVVNLATLKREYLNNNLGNVILESGPAWDIMVESDGVMIAAGAEDIERMAAFTRKVAKAFAQSLLEQNETQVQSGIIIAFDRSARSPYIGIETACTLGYHDFPVHILPGPVHPHFVSFAIRYLQACGGVLISGDSNDTINFQRVKIFCENGQPAEAAKLQKIMERIEQVEEGSIKVASEREMILSGRLNFIGKEVKDAYLLRQKLV